MALRCVSFSKSHIDHVSHGTKNIFRDGCFVNVSGGDVLRGFLLLGFYFILFFAVLWYSEHQCPPSAMIADVYQRRDNEPK